MVMGKPESLPVAELRSPHATSTGSRKTICWPALSSSSASTTAVLVFPLPLIPRMANVWVTASIGNFNLGDNDSSTGIHKLASSLLQFRQHLIQPLLIPHAPLLPHAYSFHSRSHDDRDGNSRNNPWLDKGDNAHLPRSYDIQFPHVRLGTYAGTERVLPTPQYAYWPHVSYLSRLRQRLRCISLPASPRRVRLRAATLCVWPRGSSVCVGVQSCSFLTLRVLT